MNRLKKIAILSTCILLSNLAAGTAIAEEALAISSRIDRVTKTGDPIEENSPNWIPHPYPVPPAPTPGHPDPGPEKPKPIEKVEKVVKKVSKWKKKLGL